MAKFERGDTAIGTEGGDTLGGNTEVSTSPIAKAVQEIIAQDVGGAGDEASVPAFEEVLPELLTYLKDSGFEGNAKVKAQEMYDAWANTGGQSTGPDDGGNASGLAEFMNTQVEE